MKMFVSRLQISLRNKLQALNLEMSFYWIAKTWRNFFIKLFSKSFLSTMENEVFLREEIKMFIIPLHNAGLIFYSFFQDCEVADLISLLGFKLRWK